MTHVTVFLYREHEDDFSVTVTTFGVRDVGRAHDTRRDQNGRLCRRERFRLA